MKKCKKSSETVIYMVYGKTVCKDYFLTVFIFVVCTLIGLLFQKLNFTDTNIVTIYILGVLITSIVTDGYLCSVAGSF